MPTCLWSNIDDPLLANLLADLTADEKGHSTRTSGGVYVFKAPGGKRYALKTSTNPVALKDEVFVDAARHRLGFNVPQFSLYQSFHNELPEAIKKVIPKPKTETDSVLFCLAEYVEANEDLSDEKREKISNEKLTNGFVVDCFFANTDIGGHLMKRPVDDISASEIQNQCLLFLNSGNDLIELFYDMQKKINFNQPEILLKRLVNRLQYLHEHISPEFYLYASKHSESSVDYSAAGIFLVANVDGKKQVLLGKCKRHNWWGSFGGGSEKSDLFLRDTAARRSNEKLLGLYKIIPQELDKLPSHDLIVEDTQESLYAQKFRMYFVEREAISANEFNEKIKAANPLDRKYEHDEFIWIPIDAILSAQTIEHTDWRYGKQKTLAVSISLKDGSQKNVILHAALAQMLQQHPVQAQLKSLAEKNKIANHQHTRGRSSENYPIKTTEGVKNPNTLTPMAERYELASTTVRRGLMQQKLVGETKEQRESLDKLTMTESKTEVPPAANNFAQSAIHLQAIMGDDFNNNKEKGYEEIIKIFDTKYRQHRELELGSEEYKKFADMIIEETKHPKSICFNHATQNNIAFLYDIFTEFRKQLEHLYSDDLQILRGLDDLFTFKNMTEFLAAYLEKKLDDDLAPFFTARNICVNCFLFGADGGSAESTYVLYLKNMSVLPPIIEKLFYSFVEHLQIKVDFTVVFEPIFKRFYANRGGTCYQIFIDKDCVDDVAYPSAAGGIFKPLMTEHGEIRSFSQILDELRKNPVKYSAYIQSLQARLYLLPGIFHDSTKVIFKAYQFKPLSATENKKCQIALSQAVADCLTQFLANYKKLPTAAFARAQGKPSLHRQMGMVYQQTGRLPIQETSDIRILISDAIKQSDVQNLLEIILNNEDLDLTESVAVRDHIEGTTSVQTLLTFFKNNSKLSEELFVKLQGYHDKPYISKILDQLQPIAWLYHVSIGNLPKMTELFDVMWSDQDKQLIAALELIGNKGQTEIFDWLLKKYHESNCRLPSKIYRSRESVLSKAVKQGHHGIVEQILAMPDIKFDEADLIDMLVLAEQCNDLKMIDVILEKIKKIPAYISKEVFVHFMQSDMPKEHVKICQALKNEFPEMIETYDKDLQSAAAASSSSFWSAKPKFVNEEHQQTVNESELPLEVFESTEQIPKDVEEADQATSDFASN